MMGGRMNVLSQKGKGSTFWFEVPFKRESPAKPDQRHVDNLVRGLEGCCIPKGKLVLVVEDSPIIQMLAMKQLVTLGVHCQAVSNGRAALDAASCFAFDLILMDCQMPEMDGFAATRAIRERESGSGRHTPIIAMTAGAMTGDRDKCLSAGMDD
jgi:CheY-like chemotaxis protein